MKNNILLAVALVLSLSGCSMFREVVKVPVYQEIVVQHPTPTPPPTLNNPPIRVVGARDLSIEAAKPENADKIYFVMNQEGFKAHLLDEVEKLEYAQSETRRADYYRDMIDQSNARVREKNKNASE